MLQAAHYHFAHFPCESSGCQAIGRVAFASEDELQEHLNSHAIIDLTPRKSVRVVPQVCCSLSFRLNGVTFHDPVKEYLILLQTRPIAFEPDVSIVFSPTPAFPLSDSQIATQQLVASDSSSEQQLNPVNTTLCQHTVLHTASVDVDNMSICSSVSSSYTMKTEDHVVLVSHNIPYQRAVYGQQTVLFYIFLCRAAKSISLSCIAERDSEHFLN